MLKNRLLTTLMCIFTVILIITFSIALPIYIRPFYYCQIDSLNLVEKTGYEKITIIKAYDEVLDYLTIPDAEFSVGEFEYSNDGKSHFDDCKILFNINAVLLLLSLTVVIILLVLAKKNLFEFSRPLGRHFTFLCGLTTVFIFILVGIFMLSDFQKVFVVFHNIFFFGKENWVFDIMTDPIIKILPKEFFLNCAFLVVGSVLLISFILLIFGLLKGKKKI